MRGSVGIGLALVGGLVHPGPSAAASPRPAPECRPGPLRADRLAALAERGELVLGSGARAVLSDLRWPEDGARAEAAAAWLLAWRDRPLAVSARGEPDRWGRSRVDAAIEDGAVDLAGGLVAAGLATVDAGEGDRLCRPALLALERAAREAGRGVWRDPQPAVADGAALRASAGRFIVVEGRLVGVGERPGRTYLDFVARGRDGLTVTVSKRTWRQLQERGLSAATLRGRLVRVRGVVEMRRGPLLDLASADMIEVLDEERAPRR